MKFDAVLSKAINVSDYQQPSRVKSSFLIRTVSTDYECLAQILLRYAHPLPPFNPNRACSLDESVLTTQFPTILLRPFASFEFIVLIFFLRNLYSSQCREPNVVPDRISKN